MSMEKKTLLKKKKKRKTLKDNANIIKFANASLLDALNMVQCGFELETIRLAGKNNNDYFDHYRGLEDEEDCSYHEFFLRELDYLQNVEIHEDGSVSGPEIVTMGPVSVKKFSSIVEALFKHDIEISTNCSFHIHMSLPSVKHKYSQAIQMLLIEGIFRQFNQVPESVKERWAQTSWLRDYFRLNLWDEKYQFVAHRGGWNTWEFRCWGNISNANDARRCLLISVRALQFAYRCLLKMERSNFESPQHFLSIADTLEKKVLAERNLSFEHLLYQASVSRKDQRRTEFNNYKKKA